MVTTRQQLDQTVAAILPPDLPAMERARDRQAILTKPPGSLGALEETSVRLAGIAGACPPPYPTRAAVAVFAADHGVVDAGVTPWPQEVTAVMVENFRRGGAAVNVLARHNDADVTVVDVGVAGDVPADRIVRSAKVRRGTADLSQGPAMSADEALRALGEGIALADDLVAGGYDVLVTGDMGIGNTTASACLIAHLTGRPAGEITGRGTGVDDATLKLKTDIVATSIARLGPDVDPVSVLAEVGGLEHAAIAGFLLSAARHRVPVVLDGVIAGAAALVAQRLCADVTGYCLAGHRSVEPGHSAALAALGLRPLVDLDLRLGEGTGAVLALPLVRSAAAVLREMATFEEAGIAHE